MIQNQLERYSFLWSEARLVIAAVALLIGGRPPIFLLPIVPLYGIFSAGLKLAWIISGVATVYLLYQWISHDKKLFGGEEQKDMIAFLIMTVSGINLGLTGLIGTNIGMTISSNYLIFVVVALAYLASTVYLYKRWSSYGEKLF